MKKQTFVHIWGYTIMRDGSIFKKNGKRMRDDELINVKWNNEVFRNVSRARFIFWCFNQDKFDFYDRNVLVVLKDSNKDIEVDNLKLIKKENVVRGRKKLTDEQVEEVKRQYKEEHRNFNDLAKRFKVSNTMIAYLIKGREVNYDNPI